MPEVQFERAVARVRDLDDVRSAQLCWWGEELICLVVPVVFCSPVEIRAVLGDGAALPVPTVVAVSALPSADDIAGSLGALLAEAEANGTLYGYEEASDELEEQLITELEVLLGAGPVGATDPFFDLGVDSLMAMQVISTLDDASVTLEDVFAAGNVRRLAEHAAFLQK
jgi:acyl carrier protein